MTGEDRTTPRPDTLVRCSRCQREEHVDFARCLASGWPKCHGYTMTMVSTTADVGVATTGVLVSHGRAALQGAPHE